MNKIKYIWVDISRRMKSGRIMVGNKTRDKFLDSMRLTLEYSVTLLKKTKTKNNDLSIDPNTELYSILSTPRQVLRTEDLIISRRLKATCRFS